MIDTYEIEKAFYYRVLEILIIGMYAVKQPIESIKTASEVRNFKNDAVDYYNCKQQVGNVRNGDIIDYHIQTGLFSSKVNHTMALITMELDKLISRMMDEFVDKTTLPIGKDAIDALKSVTDYAAINTCTHEETHRGGSIWEICDQCGAKWADDEGGKPDDAHELPEEIKKAYEILDKYK